MLSVSNWTAENNQILESVISNALFRCHVCLPCIVQSYNSVQNTIECQPTIREKVVSDTGVISYQQYPILINVPVIFPSNSQCEITFPIVKGDEVLVLFSDLSIDNFWLKGNIQNPVEVRRHDLSDGIAIPCSLSLPKVQSSPPVKISLNQSDIVLTTPNGSVSVNSLISFMSFISNHVHTNSAGKTGGPENP